MKALSIRQPWAWLIVNGHKDIENRTWESLYRGPILIHAGQTMTRADYEACWIFIAGDMRITHVTNVLPRPADLPRGGIVGRADLTGCVRAHESPWFCGPFGLKLANAGPLPFEPLKGALGMFNVEAVA